MSITGLSASQLETIVAQLGDCLRIADDHSDFVLAAMLDEVRELARDRLNAVPRSD